jgi:transposase
MPPVFIKSRPALFWTLHQEVGEMEESQELVVGVDTHKARHSAALVDGLGGVVASTDVGANQRGYVQLLEWARGRSPRRTWVVEGTGSYGAGLASFLARCGEVVYEGDRPQRRKRGAAGKSDQLDAIKVAREALARKHHAVPRQRGNREAVRVLLSTREGVVTASRQALNQLYALVVTAPGPIHQRLIGLRGERLVGACIRLRCTAGDVETSVTTRVLRQVARRIRSLQAEAADYEAQLENLVTETVPALLAEPGVGAITAAQLLVSWSHAGRIRNENAFAAMAGVAPIPASSGRVVRHRLNRQGDRRLNRALHVVAICRSSFHAPTKDYIARRTAEGKSTREIRRCLKRYLARRFFRLLSRA